MESHWVFYAYKKDRAYPLPMESEEELRRRIEELEKGLAQAKWRADMEAQKVRDQAMIDEIRKENKKENNTFYWAVAIFIVLPILYVLLK
jgi:hypothetical protein